MNPLFRAPIDSSWQPPRCMGSDLLSLSTSAYLCFFRPITIIRYQVIALRVGLWDVLKSATTTYDVYS